MRVDAVLLVALALVAGAYASTSPVPTLVASGALLAALLFSGAIGARVGLCATLALLVGAGRAHLALTEYEREHAAVRSFVTAPVRCALSGLVVGSPAQLGEGLAFDARGEEFDCEGRMAAGPWSVRLYGGPSDLARGDRFFAVANLAVPQVFYNRELADPRPRQAQKGVVLSGGALALEVRSRGAGLGSFIDRARSHARERISRTFSPAAAPLALALVLGETNLDPADAEAFRQSGLAHLLAVSGTHLVFAVLGVLRVLRYLLLRLEALALHCEIDRVVAGVGVLLAPLYADFAGGSGSAWRAAYMLSAGLLVKALGRRPLPSRALAASLLVGSVVSPVVAYDISFLLSLAATVGLLTLGRRMTEIVGPSPFRALQFLQTTALLTLASMLPCLPMLAVLSPSFTLASIGANVIAAPLGEAIALPLCLLHAVTTPWPALELGVARVASGALVSIGRLAHASAEVAWLRCAMALPSPSQLAALVVACGCAWVARGCAPGSRSRRMLALAVALCCVLLGVSEFSQRAQGSPKGSLRVTAVDVGQGDATLIDLPTGAVMLIDGGGFVGSPLDPGRRVLEPLLRARRRERIDVMVLSHPHPDHFTGLLHVAQRFEVMQFWDTGQGETQGAGPVYAQLLEVLREQGTRIVRPDSLCGTRNLGGARLQVLAPCPAFDPQRGANDNSFVLRLQFGRHAVLLMGDAEREEEHALLRTVPVTSLRADLLKVGHHGSRTSSSPELLRAVRPRLATVSCGMRNSFGHPHAEAMRALAAQGVKTLRLDEVGSVVWTSDGRHSSFETSRDRSLWHGGSGLW